MKREGRQHGVVRSYAILPTLGSQKRYVKRVDSACVTGIFTKVSRKPTNQSKFTGKCGMAQCLGCHIHPATKSKDKTKGTMKLRSIGSDHGKINCPPGTSASAYLDNDVSYDYDDDEYDYDDETSCHGEGGIDLASFMVTNDQHIEDEDKDECMSYCDVGLSWGEEDEDELIDYDGWFLVGDTTSN